ncbi:MAG: hypothetical protein IT330_01865, partial [Anaerolineae bacterium]|nr:hypothetical protein [Anaerolineae bacterium]
MTPEFHWLEDETDKQQRPTGRYAQVVPPQESRPRKFPRFLGVALLFILSISAGVSGAVWFMSHRGLSAARADIEAVVRTESQALARGDRELYQSLQDTEPAQESWDFFERMQNEALLRATDPVDAEQPLRITNLELLEDRAWAEVAFTRAGEPYRRMQFYRLVEGLWRRTLPDARFWGEARTRKTSHLLFIYHEREENLVNALAMWAEVAYSQILRDLGAQPWPTPIVLEFRTEEDGRTIDIRGGRFGLPSPFLSGYREDGHLDDTLRYSVAYNLALASAVSRAGLTQRSRTDTSWLMLNSVVEWQVAKLVPGGGASGPDAVKERIRQAMREDDLLPLAALWPPYRLMRSSRDFSLALVEAQTLLEYAEEKAGPEVIPSIL